MAYNKLPTLQSSTKYKQGLYRLTESSKYISDPSRIVYRSSLEYKLMVYLDNSEKVIKWGSETHSIPYMMPELKDGIIVPVKHTYHIDFYAEVINEDSPTGTDRLLIEVKPHQDYINLINNTPPEKPKNMTAKSLKNWEYSLNEYNRNLHKWTYATDFAARSGMKFIVVTEEVLNNLMK